MFPLFAGEVLVAPEDALADVVAGDALEAFSVFVDVTGDVSAFGSEVTGVVFVSVTASVFVSETGGVSDSDSVTYPSRFDDVDVFIPSLFAEKAPVTTSSAVFLGMISGGTKLAE